MGTTDSFRLYPQLGFSSIFFFFWSDFNFLYFLPIFYYEAVSEITVMFLYVMFVMLAWATVGKGDRIPIGDEVPIETQLHMVRETVEGSDGTICKRPITDKWKNLGLCQNKVIIGCEDNECYRQCEHSSHEWCYPEIGEAEISCGTDLECLWDRVGHVPCPSGPTSHLPGQGCTRVGRSLRHFFKRWL